MRNKDANHIGVFGATGSGKSAYTKNIILPTRKRVIVFDVMDEYSALGFKRVTAVDGVRAAFASNYALAKVAFVPQQANHQPELNALAEWVRHFLQGNRNLDGTKRKATNYDKNGLRVTLVVEELNTTFPIHAGAISGCPELAGICSQGRHVGIELVGVSQRMAEVSTRFRGNCTETVGFRQKYDNDRKTLKGEIGRKSISVDSMENLDFFRERTGKAWQGTIKFNKNGKATATEKPIPKP